MTRYNEACAKCRGWQQQGITSLFDGYQCHVLDIDPAVEPDVLCDALEMHTLDGSAYDGVFCSHNLEHFYIHDVPKVLAGFIHVLKPGGIAQIIVPNLNGLFESMRQHNLDIGDVWYRTGSGNAVTFHDVLYGWNAAMSGGNLFYAHKCGFTAETLGRAMKDSGFTDIHLWVDTYNLYARGTKCL